LGLNFVTFYELGQKAASAVKMIPALLLSALVPAISELEAVSEHEKLKDLYRRGSKYICLVVFPLLFITLICAPQLIKLWVGPGYDLSVLTFQILAIEYSLNLLTGMGTSIVRGIGKPEYEARYAVIVMVSQLILSIIFVQLMGYKGVLLGLLISGITGSLYFLITFHKFFEEKFSQFATEIYLKSLSSSILAFLAVLLLSFYLGKLMIINSGPGALVFLFFKVIVFSSIFLFLIIKSRYIDVTDIQLFKSYIGRT